MFAKLKSSPVSPTQTGTVIDMNPIAQYFEIGKHIGAAGPELAWKIYEGVRKTDRKEVSIFFYDKRTADKLHKPKRKETIAEILRFSVRQLDRFRHPRILSVVHSVEESGETLAFATEPVLGSLANVFEYLEDRLPQTFESCLRDNQFLDFDIKYGLLQIVEALMHLHHNFKVIHRNISPQSILINKKGTWKLAGFEFVEKCNETDIMNWIACQPYTSKLPKMGQPDLDFTAPEVQTRSICTPLSDMFSLGLLITFLYNNGKSLICANLNSSTYLKQLDSNFAHSKQSENLLEPILELLNQKTETEHISKHKTTVVLWPRHNLNISLNQLLPNIPNELHESLKSLLEIDYNKRPTSQSLTMSKYFADSNVQALHYLDIIQMKDSVHKSNFYHNLKNLLPTIPKKMWFQHILPSMVCELQSPEVLAAALQPIIYMINKSTVEEFQEFIFPFIKNIFQMPKSVQATVTLLENIDILMLKTCTSDFFKTEIVPMICNAFDSSSPQIQSAAMSALSQVIDHLDEATIRKMVLPKTKQLFDANADVKIQINILICVEKVIGNLDKADILDDVLPMIMCARTQDISVLIIVINICKLMMMDLKKYGLTVNILATKIMPTLVPAMANVNLNLEEFNDLVSLLNEMLSYVAKSQRNKLALEKKNSATTIPTAISALSSIKITPETLDANNLAQNSMYPCRPPSLRLDSRRTSISMDDVVRRASLTSAASSPDSNLLRVQAHLPGRRHSDNTILPPRILIAPSTPTKSFSLSRGPSTGNLSARRHSSIVGMKEIKDAKNLLPNIPKLSQNISNNLGIESFLSSRSSGRRYSAVPTFDKLSFTSANHHHHRKNSSTNLLQTIGTGVQQLFGK